MPLHVDFWHGGSRVRRGSRWRRVCGWRGWGGEGRDDCQEGWHSGRYRGRGRLSASSRGRKSGGSSTLAVLQGKR